MSYKDTIIFKFPVHQLLTLNSLLMDVIAAELPQSLSFLYVEGNPCCDSQEGLREYLRTALPNLKELDGDPLTDYSWYE